jgi:hypothetical protein
VAGRLSSVQVGGQAASAAVSAGYVCSLLANVHALPDRLLVWEGATYVVPQVSLYEQGATYVVPWDESVSRWHNTDS